MMDSRIIDGSGVNYSGKPSVSSSFGAFLAGVAKASGGNVLSVHATNASNALVYLQIHNKATNPSAGNTATYSFPIPTISGSNPGQILIDQAFFSDFGSALTTGVAWGLSTTAGTYTAAAAAANHNVIIHYN